jgi:hypothetical protein
MNRAPCMRERNGGARCPSCVDRFNGYDPDGDCDEYHQPASQPAIQPAPQPALRCPSCEGDAADEWSGTEGIDWALCAKCQPDSQPAYDADNDALWWMDGESEPAPQPAIQPYLCPKCDRPQPGDCVCWMYDPIPSQPQP